MGFERSMVFYGVCLVLVLGSLRMVTAERYCGNELPRVLAMLCLEYYTMDDIKRNTIAPFAPDWSGEDYQNDVPYQNDDVGPHFKQPSVVDPFARWFKMKSTPTHAKGSIGAFARFRRDVANECCKQECSMKQLLAYCKVIAPGVLDK